MSAELSIAAAGAFEHLLKEPLMHHPLQCAEPDLANNFDVDTDLTSAAGGA